MNERMNFNKYIFQGETFLNIDRQNGINAEMNIEITRYLKNKFIIFLTFYTCDNDYSGVIEFTFDLDDYLIKA